MFINGMGFLVSILYTHTVVGGVVKCTGVIYGVRTSLFLTSQRMPSRYGDVHEHLQLYKRNNYIYVNVIIYVYIRTHRWLYVVITTKVRNFLVRYFINAALLVIIHIPRTQKWAAQCNAPLRFGKRTERRYVYKLKGVRFRYYIHTPLLVGL